MERLSPGENPGRRYRRRPDRSRRDCTWSRTRGNTTANQRVHIAPFWDDFFNRGNDALWTYQPDPNTFIIQWTDVNRSGGSTASNLYDMNFQVVLSSDGTFEFRYGKLAPPPGLNYTSCYPSTCELEANGSSATVGFQSTDGLIAQVLHFGGQGEANVKPFEGGLSNRTFRVNTIPNGSEPILVEGTRDLDFCAWVGTYMLCEIIEIKAVVSPEELMITELMLTPAGGAGEQWFELRNLTNEAIDLNRIEFRNTRGTHAISSSVLIPAYGYIVAASSTVPGYTPEVIYGANLGFDPGLDRLEVWAGPTLVTSLEWDLNWSFPADKTLALDSVMQLKGRPTLPFEHWCEGTQLGTPGSTNPTCNPNQYYEVDPNGEGSWIDLSVIGTRTDALEATGSVTQLEVPGFAGTFFGSPVTTVWAGTKGWLSFSTEQPTSTTLNPPAVTLVPRSPTANPSGPLIVGFWDNLICNIEVYECSFTYFYGDVEGKKVLVAEWDGYRVGTSAVGSISFQIQLWDDGDVKVVFGDVYTTETPGTTNANYYRGHSAWIALENSPTDGPDAYISGLHRMAGDLEYRVFHFKAK